MKQAEHTNSNFIPHETLGEGGMGRVHKARDVRLEREIALKELKPDQNDDRDAVRRFIQEAKVTGQLMHPGIPPVYELGQNEDGTPFIALQLVEGTTLETVLSKLREGDPETHAEYTFERRIQVIQRICETLDYAHNRGWIHRDLKPANIMLGRYGEVYVMDWGVAKFIGEPTPGVMRNTYSETKAGVFTGTPQYASPEQLSSQEHLGPESDQYSVGVVLYELMTLSLPHEHADLRELVSMVLTKPPTPPESLKHSTQGRVAREVSLMILRALEKDPAKRYPTVKALSADLQLYVQNQARPVCPHTQMKQVLFRLNRFMDDHPLVGGVLVYGWMLLPIVLTVALVLK